MSDLISLLAAFGIGSVISVMVQSWLNSRNAKTERIYQERKEAYLGLLEAWVAQENHGVDEANARLVGHWALRVKLVGSPNVFDKIKHWENTKPGSPERFPATDKLKAAMRDDLAL